MPIDRLRAVAEEIAEACDAPVAVAGGHISLGTRTRGRSLLWHSADLDREVEERLFTLGELQQAAQRGQLRLEYQPKVSRYDGAVLGVEALMRWAHLRYGSVPPACFILLAESSGLIGQLAS